MRDRYILRWFGSGRPAGGGVRITMGLLGCLACAAAEAREAQDERLARLGFAFDQKVHDAAVAKATASQASRSADEPPATGTIRLPKYVVTGKAAPPAEHEVMTEKGRIEAAKKRYLNPAYQKTLGQIAAVATFLSGVNHGWRPNSPEAMALYEDGEQKRRNREMRDLNELTELAKLSEAAASGSARSAVRKPPKK